MTAEQNEPPPTDPWLSILNNDGLPGPLACRAAMRIINENHNPGERHDDAHHVTASLIAQVIHRETAADELLEALQAAKNTIGALSNDVDLFRQHYADPTDYDHGEASRNLEDTHRQVDAAIAKARGKQ